MKSGAGLALAPPSNGSGGPCNGYIVDRGVDNDTNQDTFNDGKLYEIAIPGLTGSGGTGSLPCSGGGGGGGNEHPTDRERRLRRHYDASGVRPSRHDAVWNCQRRRPSRRVDGDADVDKAQRARRGDVRVSESTTTTASFPVAGTYVIRLTATDGSATAADELTVTVNPASGGGGGNSGVVDATIVASADDAEQVVSSGAVTLASGDLNLPLDGNRLQMAGMRFSGVTVPQNATITRAYVQFQADEVSTGPVTLSITGQLATDAAGFTTATSSISSRSQTAGVTWSPADWSVLGARTAVQQTADISSVVDAIVSQSGWASGNHLVLIVKQTSGAGNRIAESFDGGAAKASVLHIGLAAPDRSSGTAAHSTAGPSGYREVLPGPAVGLSASTSRDAREGSGRSPTGGSPASRRGRGRHAPHLRRRP